MATCLKRTSKLFDISLLQSSVDISLRDLICPVCRSILIEPVTLPCTHNLCLKCLKGTFEHNSLSCPLCRIRVGSWLRTATRTETLVNNALWELIRTKFPKEIESKYNGLDNNIDLDVDFESIDRTLCTAGEIRREYEVQLRMAEEEIQCQRKAEQIASEALIRQIQEEEEQQQLVQMKQDQLLAKSLVKKQMVKKHKEPSKCCNSYPGVTSDSFSTSKFNVATMTEINLCKMEAHSSKSSDQDVHIISESNPGLKRSNVALLSKIRAERYASNVKSNDFTDVRNDSTSKFCCQKAVPMYSAIARTLKHQATTKTIESCVTNHPLESGTSGKIYGTRIKEELHIPEDVVNSKKKSLGVEVCISSGEDDERMGSAESAGSHDSINQEIHHFKPIKAMPRTPLKISTDGRQIDPKLIRVVPMFKRISNVIPRPPSQTHLKRIIGCSWSAFRGKTKQSVKDKEACKEEDEHQQRASTSSCNQSEIIHNKLVVGKCQTHVSTRKVDFLSESLFDSNKNYAKGTSKVINGTKIGKKLPPPEDHRDIKKIEKSWRSHIRNGMVCKSKRQRNLWVKKEVRSVTGGKYVGDIETRDSTLSSMSVKIGSPCDENEEIKVQREDEMTVENIAERIKKRKTNVDKKSLNSVSLNSLNSFNSFNSLNSFDSFNSAAEVTIERSTRKRLYRKQKVECKGTEGVSVTIKKRSKAKHNKGGSVKSKSKQSGGVGRAKRSGTESSEKSDGSVGSTSRINSNRGLRKATRKTRYNRAISEQERYSNNYNSSESCTDPLQECIPENNNTEMDLIVEKSILSDEEIIKEQERMERLVIQEKEDFELARRLQAKFDEMERIAGRTRRSRRVFESETIELDLYKIDVAGKSVQKAINSHTAKSSSLNHTVTTEVKKRGRPPKRVK